MNEPQELRSIDELFKNTFNNLPDTPAENGWDTPSNKVWRHVRDNLQAPRSGWSWQSLLILSGFAVAVVLGLYLAFAPATTSEAVKTPASPAPAAQVETETTPALVSVPEVPVQQHIARPAPQKPRTVAKPTPPATPIESVAVSQTSTPVSLDKHQPHSLSAAPLPGTRSIQSPNTTEELKVQHQRELELLWKTPLKMLPVPREK